MERNTENLQSDVYDGELNETTVIGSEPDPPTGLEDQQPGEKGMLRGSPTRSHATRSFCCTIARMSV